MYRQYKAALKGAVNNKEGLSYQRHHRYTSLSEHRHRLNQSILRKYTSPADKHDSMFPGNLHKEMGKR